MFPTIERRDGVQVPETRPPLSLNELYTALDKKPRSSEEIVFSAPKALPLVETYQQELLGDFLSQKIIITQCRQVHDLKGQWAQLETTFQTQMQDYHLLYQELIEGKKRINEQEKTVKRKIASSKNSRVIWHRTRVKLYQLRGQPGQRFWGKVLNLIPGIPIPEHPLLTPRIQEKERIETAIDEISGKITAAKSAHDEGSGLLETTLRTKQDHLGETFILWVTDNLERLIAHLVLFPSEISPLRKIFHQRFAKDRQRRMAFDERLKEIGLLKTPPVESSTPVVAVNGPPRMVKDHPVTGNGWGVIFVEHGSGEVIRSPENLAKIVRELLEEKKCPPERTKAVIRSLLRFQLDPVETTQRVGTVKGEKLRSEIGKNKLYLPGGWRALFKLVQNEEYGRVIEIQRIISHGEWEKKF